METTDTRTSALRPLQLWLLTAGAFFSFFTFGFVDNLKGPLLPNLLQDLNFNYSQGGGVLFGAYLGFVIATLLAGPLSDWIGNRLVLLAAGLFIAAGHWALSSATSYSLLFGAMMIVGLGTGSIEVGGNGLIVSVHRAAQGRFLNLLATFHGIGSLVAPLFAAWLIGQDVSWRRIFQLVIPLGLLLAITFLLTRAPANQQTGGDKAASHGFDWATLRRSGFSGTMICFYLAIGLYVATELGMAAWMVEYLLQNKGISQTSGSLYLSAFFAAIMVGRIVGSFVVDRIGLLHAVLLAASGALICIALTLFAPPALIFFLPLSGLFLSIIFPTITAAVSNLHPQNTGTILGLLFTAGGLGGTLGPWAIGVVSDALGTQTGFGLNLLFCAGTIGMVAILLRLVPVSR